MSVDLLQFDNTQCDVTNDANVSHCDEYGTSNEDFSYEKPKYKNDVHSSCSHKKLTNCEDTYKEKKRWSSSYYMWRKPSTLKLSPQKIPIQAINKVVDTTTHKPSLLDLPNELLLFILSFLSFKDLTMCRLVCRQIYQLAFDSTLKYGCNITLENTLTPAKLKQAVLLTPSSLILKQCHCSLSSIDIETCMMILGDNLKHLTIDTCSMGPLSNDVLLSGIAQHCIHLVTVNIQWIQVNGKCILELVKRCSRLEVLSLQNVSGISLKHCKKIISKLSHNHYLHTLSIKLCPEVPLSTLFESSQYVLTSLRTLSLSQNISKVQLFDIHLLTMVAPFILTLNIECVEICREAVKYLKQQNINMYLQGIITKLNNY